MFALVDGNNFYVSCERAFRPSLKRWPVVVLSNNDGCAIARSNDYVESPDQSSFSIFKTAHSVSALAASLVESMSIRGRAACQFNNELFVPSDSIFDSPQFVLVQGNFLPQPQPQEVGFGLDTLSFAGLFG
ncbi:hypothetical protein BH10PSE16_BH10PSE16_30530 [soil metagenome]